MPSAAAASSRPRSPGAADPATPTASSATNSATATTAVAAGGGCGLGGGQAAGQLRLLLGDLGGQLLVDRGQLRRLGQLALHGRLGLLGEVLLLRLGGLDPVQRRAGRDPLALGVGGHLGLVLPLDLDVLVGGGELVEDVGLAVGLDL